MNVIDATSRTYCPNASETDFKFIHDIIAELNLVPTKSKVTFPLPNRSSAFAEIDCKLYYNDDYKPCGEFFFHLRDQQLEMAHSAIVTTLVVNGKLQLQLTIKPNGRLRRSGHRSILRTIPTVREMASAICANYFPGSPGRKVVVNPTVKQAA